MYEARAVTWNADRGRRAPRRGAPIGLTHAKPPDGLEDSLQEKLEELHPPPKWLESAGDSFRLFDIGEAIPVYGVDKSEIAAGRLLESARLIAWRSVVDHGGGTFEAIDFLDPSDADGKLAFGGLNAGPFAKALQVGVEAAGELPQVGQTDYELRLFNGAPVSFLALWLHPRGEGKDLFLPLHDAGPLTAGAVATPAEVLAFLQAEAQPAAGPGWDELG